MQMRPRNHHPPSPTDNSNGGYNNDSTISVDPATYQDDEKKSFSILSPHFYVSFVSSKLVLIAVASVIFVSLLSLGFSRNASSDAVVVDKELDVIEKQLGLSDEYPVYDVGAVVADEIVEPSKAVTSSDVVSSDSKPASSASSDTESEEDTDSMETTKEQDENDEVESSQDKDESSSEDTTSTEKSENVDVEEDENDDVEENKLSDEDLFVDQKEYNEAPMIQVLPESSKLKYRSIVLQHERHYRKHPSRLYVPRLKPNLKLSIKEFADRFHRTSQPVIVPFEAMRHLGFNTRSFTMDELLKMYPNRKPMIYKYGGSGSGELDLGPAIYALARDEKLKKTSKGRNYPRNMKLGGPQVISKLTVQEPPYVLPGTQFMAPSLWFGSTTASTKFHSDCCDNFAMMIMGTKIWTLSPPSEARILHPKCAGGLCWVKSLEHPDEHANTDSTIALRDKLQRFSFELRPGEMLYLPCGWFHHVENKEPTIMVNWWTKSRAMFLVFKEEENGQGPVTQLS